MRYFNLFLPVFIFCVTAQAQTNIPGWQWVRADTNVSVRSTPNSVTAAAPGKLLLCGFKSSKFSSGYFNYGVNEITEYDNSGNVLASEVLGGTTHMFQVAGDGSGNWYALGWCKDSVSFPSGYSSHSAGFFICCLNGGTLTPKWFHNLTIPDVAVSFYVRGSKCYLVADSGAVTKVYLVDTGTGNMTSVIHQENTGRSTSIVADGAGNIYVAGSCMPVGIADFNGHSVTTTRDNMAYIVRYKADGTYDWSCLMNDGACALRQLNMGDDNTIYYTGYMLDSLSLGGISLHKNHYAPQGDFLAASLDSTGNARWISGVFADTVNGAALLQNYRHAAAVDSYLVVATLSAGYIDWGTGVITNNPTGYSTMTIAGYGARSGNTLWLKTISFPQPASGVCKATDIMSDGRDIYISGFASDSAYMTADTVMQPLYGTYRPFLAKLKMPPPSMTTGVGNIAPADKLVIVPNPAHNMLTITGWNTATRNAEISLHDITGKTVLRKDIARPSGARQVDVSGFATGVYMLEIRQDAVRVTRKLVLQ